MFGSWRNNYKRWEDKELSQPLVIWVKDRFNGCEYLYYEDNGVIHTTPNYDRATKFNTWSEADSQTYWVDNYNGLSVIITKDEIDFSEYTRLKPREDIVSR